MSWASPIPASSNLRTGPLGSMLRCSRLMPLPGSAATVLQIWTMLKADSSPTDGGIWFPTYPHTQAVNNFYARDPSAMVSAALADHWTGFPNVPSDDNGGNNQNATLVETPSSYSPPYDSVCGTVASGGRYVAGPYAYGPDDNLFSLIYGDSITPPPEWFLFRPYNGGFVGLGYMRATFWMSWQLQKGSDPTYYQNPVMAQRSKYRINGIVYGWEASADLWVQHQDSYGAWQWGWGIPFASGTYPVNRVWFKNWHVRRDVITTPFMDLAVSGNQDWTSNWNEIVLPSTGDAFYTPTDTLMNGFLGRMIVHLFEDKTAWQTRTGFTL